MKEGMDDKVRKKLQDKLQDFEGPVDEHLWTSVSSELGSTKSPIWRWAAIFILLLTFGGLGYWLLDRPSEPSALQEPTEPARELQKSREDKSIPGVREDQTESGDPSIRESKAETKALIKEPSEKTTIAGEKATHSKPPEYVVVETPEVSGTVLPGDESDWEEELPELTVLSGLTYRSMKLVFPKPELPDWSDLTQTEDQSAREPKLKFTFALTSNYLNISPNERDEVFVQAPASTDFSLNRVGVMPGLALSIGLTEKLSLKNRLYMNLRRLNLSFDFIPDASLVEALPLQRFDETYTQLGLGISPNLNYQITTIQTRRIDLDMGLMIERVLIDQVNDDLILGSPRTVLSLNFGLSVYPQEEKQGWIIRPFGFFSLNKQQTLAPVRLTPFGFGLEFSKN